MRREGRQHGMVRSYPMLPLPWSRGPGFRVNKFDSPPTAGLFTKVSSKPTNHSKFTGKCGRPRCGGCHVHPACKSKDKTKGTHKLRSCDVVANHRLISWGVVDNKVLRGLNLTGSSATGILGHLSNEQWEDDHAEDAVENEEEGIYGDAAPSFQEPRCMGKEEDMGSGGSGIGSDEDDSMSFCEVGFIWDQVLEDGDEGWCLVGEMCMPGGD